MRNLFLFVCAGLMAAARAEAQSFRLPFEAALGQVRGEFRAEQARQVQAKQSNLALEIERAARETADLAWETQFLRRDIAEVRRLARLPGQAPYLGDAVQRLMAGMTYFHDRSAYLAAQVARLSSYVRRRDPELLYPASMLYDASRRLQTEISTASYEARSAGMDLRRIGWTLQAESLERKDARIGDAVRMLGFESKGLLDKLRR